MEVSEQKFSVISDLQSVKKKAGSEVSSEEVATGEVSVPELQSTHSKTRAVEKEGLAANSS